MNDNTRHKSISPACPIPLMWRASDRLAALRNCLNPASLSYFPVIEMHENIRAAIAAYEANQMPTSGIVYFKHGRKVTESEGQIRDTYVWTEVRFQNGDAISSR